MYDETFFYNFFRGTILFKARTQDRLSSNIHFALGGLWKKNKSKKCRGVFE